MSIRKVAVLVLSAYIFSGTPSAEPLWVFFNNDPMRSVGDTVSDKSISMLTEAGARVRVVSRYFNAVSIEWDGSSGHLEVLPGVDHVAPVRSMATVHPAPEELMSGKRTVSADVSYYDGVYGFSYRQLAALNIPAVHKLGYTGSGVIIGVLDTGFVWRETECLRNIRVTHTRNFVTGGDIVTTDTHGGNVLACLGGDLQEEYYGAAYGASFLLAVTDDLLTERRADEDRWVAAIEWCDSLGADIISSSLVYNIFDTPDESYTKADMDGRTSLVAQAAEIAVSRGIVVVNAAGNEGDNSWGIITTPADAMHVIAVGAVTFLDSRPIISSFSSRGPTADGRIKPDVVAPGEQVEVPLPGTSGQYIAVNGTSYATPFIAGICALILEAHPDWTPSRIMEALKTTAVDLGEPGPDTTYGWGLPDALRAMNFTETAVNGDTVVFREQSGSDASDPQGIILGHPYPNPFNGSVTIPFTNIGNDRLTVTVHDITGRLIATLFDDVSDAAGSREISWNGKDFGSGIYFVRAVTGKNSASAKLLLLK